MLDDSIEVFGRHVENCVNKGTVKFQANGNKGVWVVGGVGMALDEVDEGDDPDGQRSESK